MDFLREEKKSVPPKRVSKQGTQTNRQWLPQRTDRAIYAARELGGSVFVQREPKESESEERQRTGQQRSEEQQRIRERVMEEFISPRHIKALERVIRSTNTIVSFRAAGAATLARIAAGAAPKPHAILDKSLKAGEFKTDGADPNGAATKMIQALEGLVPYRDDKTIKGLYLSTKGFNFFGASKMSEFRGKVRKLKNGRTYLECNPTSAEDSFVRWLLGKLKDDPEFMYAEWFVTGDYDMHDMILKTSQAAPVPSDSCDEARILTRLSYAMMGKERPRGRKQFTFVPDEFSPIQHGPQFNYIAHMMDKEKGKPIVREVADLDLKIALFDGEKWTILDQTVQEMSEKMRRAKQARALEAYYIDHAVRLKTTWRDIMEAQKRLSRFKSVKGESHGLTGE